MTKPDFTQRSRDDELMDSATIGFPEFHDCLQQLAVINILTLAYGPTLRWLQRIMPQKSLANFNIVDVGSGGGDMLRRIWRWAQRQNKSITLTGVDLNPWSKRSADLTDAATHIPAGSIQHETSDIFDFAVDRQPDIIISALFTHHLPDEMLVRFIQWMELHAQTGWFINDLHRHPIAYYFIKYVTKLFSHNRLIVHDAPVSVARSFTRADWQRLLRQAGVPLAHVTIRWHFPFRYSVARIKT